jgi:hypothetical protein
MSMRADVDGRFAMRRAVSGARLDRRLAAPSEDKQQSLDHPGSLAAYKT